MNKRKLCYWGILTLMVLSLLACAAGQEEFEAGMQLRDAGKNKEAIAYMEAAIAKDPKNKEYQAELAALKERLVQQYTEAAQQALNAQQPVTISAVNRAKAELQNARDIDPEHAAVAELAGRIQKAEAGLVADVKGLYEQVQQAIVARDWLKAYFNLQQIQSRFPNYEDTLQLGVKVQKEGANDLYAQAKAEADADNYKAAIGYLRKALSIQPDHAPSRALLGLAQERDNKGYFIQKARDAVGAQNWELAVSAYEHAQEYDPADQDLQQLILHVRSKAGQYKLRVAKSTMQGGWLLKGIETYLQAAGYLQNPKDNRLMNLQRDLVRRAKYAAEHFKEQQLFGNAWFWYSQIQSIDPDYPNIFYLLREMEDQIRQRVQKSIAVFDFSSPSDQKDAGIIVSNNLITYLFKNSSGDIKILERENLKSILEEMKLGQIGVVSGTTAKQMGRVYGIDMAIMGSVLLYKVDSTESDGMKTVRYQIGEEIGDNIDYLNWEAQFKHRKPTQRELNEAPPAKITKPRYAEKDYKVSNYKKVGFVQLSFRIVDVNTGENIQVKTIEEKKTVEDETSAGLKDANIAFDPLEIPTDTELLQQMTNKVVAELGREALRPLQNLEKFYFEEGQKHVRRRNPLEAAENFINAIFDEKMKMIKESPLSRKAFEDLKGILRDYQIEIGIGG